MKKLFTTIVALGLVAGAAFAQRTVDIASTVSSPSSGATVKSGTPFDMTMTVTNNGPDDIKAGDSLVFFLVLNGQIQNFSRIFNNESVASGASTNLTVSGINITGSQSGNLNVCGLVILVQRSGTDTVKDNSVQDPNNLGCVTVNFQSTSSIGEMSVNEVVSTVFPNPATDKATIEVQGAYEQTATVNVYDLNGKLVYTAAQEGTASNKFELSTADLENGVYVYTVTAGDKVSHGKFVVQK